MPQNNAKLVPLHDDVDGRTSPAGEATNPTIPTHRKKRRESLFEKLGRRTSLANVKHMLEGMAKDQTYLLSESSDIVRRMDVTMIILLLFTATVTPFEVCFVQENSFNVLFFINRLVDIGFVVDMGLQFFTMYRTESGEQVHDPAKVVKRYLKGWFGIDLLAVVPIPFEFLSASPSSDFQSGSNIKVLRFFRMMRIVKLARIFRASRLIGKWESQWGINYSVISLLKYMAMLTVLTHWGACFWHLAATLSSAKQGNWVLARGLCDQGMADCEGLGRIYLLSLYNSVSIMYGGTCADGFTPESDVEHIFAVVMIVCGATSYAYAIGGICNFVDSRNKAMKAFHTTVDTMNMFLADHHVAKPLRIKTREFFQRAKPVIRAQVHTFFSSSSSSFETSNRCSMNHGPSRLVLC
jgi:hypothetical protein